MQKSRSSLPTGKLRDSLPSEGAEQEEYIPYEPEDGPYDPNDPFATQAWIAKARLIHKGKVIQESTPPRSSVIHPNQAMGPASPMLRLGRQAPRPGSRQSRLHTATIPSPDSQEC